MLWARITILILLLVGCTRQFDNQPPIVTNPIPSTDSLSPYPVSPDPDTVLPDLLSSDRLPAVPFPTPSVSSMVTPTPPQVYLYNPSDLEAIRADLANPHYVTAYQTLISAAEKALVAPLLSVMQKTQVPPSGNKHDFLSLSPYYWPNPNTADGLPWIQKDGQVNPVTLQYPDSDNLDDTARNITTLAMAYYFSRQDKYAKKAVQMLRTWFLDPATAMNPNLTYAQLRTGAPPDKIYNGIIEGRLIADVADAVGFLQTSSSYTRTDQSQFKSWCSKYVNWLLTSPQGQHEASAKNNRWSWYVVQVVALSLRLGNTAQAGVWIGKAQQNMIVHFSADGSQPEEIKRTLGLSYSAFNLDAYFRLAAMGKARGYSLWTYQTSRLHKGLEFILPYALGTQVWPYQQIKPFEKQRMIPLLLQSLSVYGLAEDQQALTRLGLDTTRDRANLLYKLPQLSPAAFSSK